MSNHVIGVLMVVGLLGIPALIFGALCLSCGTAPTGCSLTIRAVSHPPTAPEAEH